MKIVQKLSPDFQQLDLKFALEINKLKTGIKLSLFNL